MGRVKTLRRLKDNSGSTLVEFSLLLPLILILTFGIIEGGYIFYQVNGAQKATQMAARIAATRPPVATNLNECASTADTSNTNAGVNCSTLPAADLITTTCSKNQTTNCENDKRLEILNKIQSAYPFVTDDNLFITYEGTGLGYVGRGKPVPAITVELRNINYDFIMIGVIIQGLGGNLGEVFKIDKTQTTVIAEDMGQGA